MKIVVMDNKDNESTAKVEQFDSTNPNQSKQASMAMALTLQS